MTLRNLIAVIPSYLSALGAMSVCYYTPPGWPLMFIALVLIYFLTRQRLEP